VQPLRAAVRLPGAPRLRRTPRRSSKHALTRPCCSRFSGHDAHVPQDA
jgi:hypothetical protein